MPSFTERQTRAPGEHDLTEPPHAYVAEQILLGALMADNQTAELVRDTLRPEHFADPLHGDLYAVALRMIDRGMTASPITLRPWFDQHGRAADVGPGYLARLLAMSVHRIEARQSAAQICRQWQLRAVLAESQRLRDIALGDDGETDLAAAVQDCASTLDDVVQRGEQGAGFKRLAHGLSEAISSIESAYQRPEQIAGLPSGFRGIDNLVGGFGRGTLIIVAGRPSMGKTALATNMAAHAAAAGVPTGFFSLEMSSEELTLRLLADGTGIPSSQLRRGMISQAGFNAAVEASQKLEAMQLFVDERAGLTLDQVRVAARRLKRQHGLGLVVLDYLQLLQASGRRRDGNRVQEVSEITRGLKTLAKELDLPVIALSQLSREVERREDKRPQLADLRDSGTIEQDGDLVMFVYRDEYYLPSMEPVRKDGEALSKFNERHEAWSLRCQQAAGRAEVIVAKHRHGPTGMVRMTFDGALTRFGDLPEGEAGSGA